MSPVDCLRNDERVKLLDSRRAVERSVSRPSAVDKCRSTANVDYSISEQSRMERKFK